MKRFLAMLMTCLLCLFVTGCGQSVDDGAGKTFEDSQFLDDLAAGLNARWTLDEKYVTEGKYTRTASEMTALVNAELDHVRKYEKATLDDETLTSLANEYVSYLVEEQSAAKLYNDDDPSTYTTFSDVVMEAERVLGIILNDYKVPIDSQFRDDAKIIMDQAAQYQKEKVVKDQLDEIASKVGISFQQTAEGLIGTLEMTNSTDLDFSLADFNVVLFDKLDIEIERTLISFSDWASGATATQEMAFTTVDMPSRIEITCNNYVLSTSAEGAGVATGGTQYVTSQGVTDPATGLPVGDETAAAEGATE